MKNVPTLVIHSTVPLTARGVRWITSCHQGKDSGFLRISLIYHQRPSHNHFQARDKKRSGVGRHCWRLCPTVAAWVRGIFSPCFSPRGGLCLCVIQGVLLCAAFVPCSPPGYEWTGRAIYHPCKKCLATLHVPSLCPRATCCVAPVLAYSRPPSRINHFFNSMYR